MKLTRGERFRDARANMAGSPSLRTVAQLSGVQYGTIQALEDDENDRGVSYREVMRLAEFYNVSIDYLLCVTDTPTRDTTTQAICQTTGLSEKAVEHLTLLNKVAEFNSASDNAMTTYQRGQIEALSFLIEHKDFNTLLTCLEYLRNPEIFKISERAGFDNLYRMAHDLSSPRVEVIAGIQYRGARAFGNIMEDALKQNPASKDKEGQSNGNCPKTR